MTAQEISNQLQGIALADDFAERTAELTENWSSAGVGIEAVEPILQFMEQHPAIDFGTPGPLVHFVEQFYGKGYEEKLIESVQRKPVAHTVWMLNRIINGTKLPDLKERLLATMTQAKVNPLADQAALQLVNRFLERRRY